MLGQTFIDHLLNYLSNRSIINQTTISSFAKFLTSQKYDSDAIKQDVMMDGEYSFREGLLNYLSKSHPSNISSFDNFLRTET